MSQADHMPTRGRRLTRRTKIVAFLVGALMVATGAAASNWIVGLSAGSSGEAQSGTIANLTITTSVPGANADVLYPGGPGDVVISITNPNKFPVTVTGFNLPTNTTYANGYTDSALTTAAAACSAATPSTVSWAFSTATSGSAHTLTSPLVVAATGAANNPLVVTLSDDAAMGGTAPSGCAGLWFKMPSFTGVVATAGGGTVTTSPATSGWTS
ncbi:MAG TPA: hypothetical protein VKQ07_07985 [Jatrophihabitantaceae bacterium]|nr:hypothetical protein [Jatrophihabitantaceae bacterium]